MSTLGCLRVAGWDSGDVVQLRLALRAVGESAPIAGDELLEIGQPVQGLTGPLVVGVEFGNGTVVNFRLVKISKLPGGEGAHAVCVDVVRVLSENIGRHVSRREVIVSLQ
jgi:hypothetical protein